MKSAFPIFASILLLLIGGQVYWIRRLGAWSRRLIASSATRKWLGLSVLAALILLFASNFGWLGRRPSSTHMTLKDVLVTAPFAWWAFSSMVAFLASECLRILFSDSWMMSQAVQMISTPIRIDRMGSICCQPV